MQRTILPDRQDMIRAVIERDERFRGTFVFAVKSTGIFCRPACPSRTPNAENLEFFPDAQQALFAGYRACKRCRPMHRANPAPQWIDRLVEQIDSRPEQRFRERDLVAQGLDPSTVRRQFQRHFGMTFHAYQRASRMGRALKQIRDGSDVIDSQIQAGYDSPSGFWRAFSDLFGEPPSQAGSVRVLNAKWLVSPLGSMLALADDEGLHLLEFVDRRALQKEIETIRKRTQAVIVPGEHQVLDQTELELAEYFQGSRKCFNLPLRLSGTEFEVEVWNRLLEIPAGTTISYQQLASSVSRPQAVRAVGRANGKNCLAIVVPCHRVIGADGKLTGYGGGLWRKQSLLEHESAT